MTIKTKKYKLEQNTYISIALKSILAEFWWVWFVPVVILIIPIIFPEALWWCVTGAITLSVLYVLFWWVQFAGAAQMEQNKILFERLSYEINSQQILIKLNAKQGMPVNWNQIQNVKKAKDHFLFILGRGQFIHLPFKVFKSENEVKFLETILKRKNYLPTTK